MSLNSKAVVADLFSHAGIRIDGDAPYDPQVHNAALFDRVLAEGALGIGEAYMSGWWDVDDLFGFFVRAIPCKALQERKNVGWRTAIAALKARLLNLQTLRQTRRLADVHYNLSNELFTHMLGPTMAYSCGFWERANDLDTAQTAKYEMICQKLKLAQGDRLLDIGCGWGGFAKHAAERHGVEVVGITVAEEQAVFASDLCSGHRVNIAICDYRRFDPNQFGGLFDKVASIGMIEHVGYRNYATFFSMVSRCLKDQGLFLLHSIGSKDSLRAGDPWLTRYIFPEGVAPSMSQLSTAAEPEFLLHDVQNIGPSYSPTLRAWHDNFEDYLKDTSTSDTRPRVWGSEDVFSRMWRYYLMSCAAHFEVGEGQVWQLVYSKGIKEGGYSRYRVS